MSRENIIESKNEKFERMLAIRLPNALKAISLISNLAARTYESTGKQKRDLIDALYDEVEAVADAFGIEEEPETAPQPAQESAPQGAGGSARGDDRHEIRWAYDALRRGDTELAEARLNMVLKRWIEEETA